MAKQITVKYYSDSNNVKKPYQASEDAAGFDVFVAETVTVMPQSFASISLKMIWSIPSRFYDQLFTRSGIFKENLVTFESGVIDSDFRGEVSALLFNHHPEKLSPLEKAIDLHKSFLWRIYCEFSKGER